METKAYSTDFSHNKSYKLEDWRGGNKAFEDELDYPIEYVTGETPSEFTGTMYRNVPAMLDVNGQRSHHLFDTANG